MQCLAYRSLYVLEVRTYEGVMRSRVLVQH